MQPLVTVVVPVYNVEAYLDRCLQSIVNQTYRNLEILLIDDGSPDNCPALCEAWAEKDERIRVIHKENAGLGMARNTGIEHASGDYLCFFDSDDYVLPETVEHALELALRESADIVIFGMAGADREGKILWKGIPAPEKTVYAGEEVQDRLLPDLVGPDRDKGRDAGLSFSACRTMISAERIRNARWRFVSEREIISEDIYSMLQLYRHVKKAAILRESLYVYCQNPTSLTHAYRQGRFEKSRFFYEQCLKLCRENGYPDAVAQRCAGPFFGNTIAAMKQEAACKPMGQALRAIRGMLRDELLQQAVKENLRKKYNRKILLLFAAIRLRSSLLCYLMARFQNAAQERNGK